MQSGSSGFFMFVMLVALMMCGAVYAIKHREDFSKVVAIAMETTGIGESIAKKPTEENDGRSGGRSDDTEIKANASGHFETEAEVNGSSIEVMIDTGATLVALTYEDAERAGVRLRSADFTHEVKTANGIAKVAPVELGSISIGDITVRNVKAAVTERGKLHKTLLGMSFLSRLSRVEMRSNALVLQE